MFGLTQLTILMTASGAMQVITKKYPMEHLRLTQSLPIVRILLLQATDPW